MDFGHCTKEKGRKFLLKECLCCTWHN